MSTFTVDLAQPVDAFAVASLHLKWDLESGAPARPGFIDEYADAWLASRDQHPTWLAKQPDGRPVGVAVATVITKLPSLRQPRNLWMHVGSVYVIPELRGDGVGTQIMTAVMTWAREHDVERLQLNATEEGVALYEKFGFERPDERFLQARLKPRA